MRSDWSTRIVLNNIFMHNCTWKWWLHTHRSMLLQKSRNRLFFSTSSPTSWREVAGPWYISMLTYNVVAIGEHKISAERIAYKQPISCVNMWSCFGKSKPSIFGCFSLRISCPRLFSSSFNLGLFWHQDTFSEIIEPRVHDIIGIHTIAANLRELKCLLCFMFKWLKLFKLQNQNHQWKPSLSHSSQWCVDSMKT